MCVIHEAMNSYGNMISYDPSFVDLTSNFFVLSTNVKVYSWVERSMNISGRMG